MVDCCGAVVGTELGVDPADMRVDGVQRDGQFACDLRPGQVCREVSKYPEFARAEFVCQWCEVLFERHGRTVHDVEDIGEQRGVRGLMPRQRFEQLPGARHREGQDQPVGLGQGQGTFGGLVRRALVTELTMGEPGQQLRLHDRDVPDDRGRAVQNILHRGQG
jgi:hypothetical protein